jgi:hypothetical protein
MVPTRVAVIFDDRQRPETTGGYCLRAFQGLCHVEHVLPDRPPLRDGFDFFLRIDDGMDYQLPAGLRPSGWWAIDTHLDFDRCLAQARACDLSFAAQRDGAELQRRAGVATATGFPRRGATRLLQIHPAPFFADTLTNRPLADHNILMFTLGRTSPTGPGAFPDSTRRLT